MKVIDFAETVKMFKKISETPWLHNRAAKLAQSTKLKLCKKKKEEENTTFESQRKNNAPSKICFSRECVGVNLV